MKKVLFLIPTLGGGGAERVLVNLVNNLDKTKYDITVKTLFKSNVNSKYLKSDIRYIEGKIKQFKGNTYVLKLFSPKFLYKFFIKDKYDLVISYLEGPTARIVAGCPENDTRLLSWIHCRLETKNRASVSFRNFDEAVSCYSRFDKNVCVSNLVKQYFDDILSLEQSAEVIYNTNDGEKILILADEPIDDIKLSNDINIISVGRLVHIKGFERLISAHKQLLDVGIKNHIYIIGDGALNDDLIKQIDALCVADTVHLLGFKHNPYKYVAVSDLYVCPSISEGFSTAVTEALILGVPVVSTLCGGAYELLGENDEYGIVTENSEQGIYEGMLKMLSSSETLHHYKEKAQERGKLFSKENTVKSVENMFDSLFNEVE